MTYTIPETIRAGSSVIEVERLQAQGDRVILRRLVAAEMGERKGLIVLPQQHQDHQDILQGVVVACGPMVSANILPGLRVICSRFQRVPLDNNGEFFVTTEDQCQAVVMV